MPIDYDEMMQTGATGLVARYDEKDVMLYQLGIGFGRDPLNASELPFVYENPALKVVPTFASVVARGDAPPERQRMPHKSSINFLMVVDGERRITIHKPLPPKAEIVADERMLAILDKGAGKGAVLVQERAARDAASGDKLFTIVSSIFARGPDASGQSNPVRAARRCSFAARSRAGSASATPAKALLSGLAARSSALMISQR